MALSGPAALRERSRSGIVPSDRGAEAGGSEPIYAGRLGLRDSFVSASRALDIGEVQALVNYPEDARKFDWHHRVILTRVRDTVWLALTLDLDIVQVDLLELDHVPVGRGGRAAGRACVRPIGCFDSEGEPQRAEAARRSLGFERGCLHGALQVDRVRPERPALRGPSAPGAHRGRGSCARLGAPNRRPV